MDKRRTLVKAGNVELPKRMQEIVDYFFAHPSMTYTELAREFQLSLPRISVIMKHPKVLANYPLLAKRSITGMIPKSLKVYDDILNQKDNLQIAERVASKILDSEKVLEPVEHKIVHELALKSVSELQEIVSKAAALPVVAIDAEIVGETEAEE